MQRLLPILLLLPVACDLGVKIGEAPADTEAVAGTDSPPTMPETDSATSTSSGPGYTSTIPDPSSGDPVGNDGGMGETDDGYECPPEEELPPAPFDYCEKRPIEVLPECLSAFWDESC